MSPLLELAVKRALAGDYEKAVELICERSGPCRVCGREPIEAKE